MGFEMYSNNDDNDASITPHCQIHILSQTISPFRPVRRLAGFGIRSRRPLQHHECQTRDKGLRCIAESLTQVAFVMQSPPSLPDASPAVAGIIGLR